MPDPYRTAPSCEESGHIFDVVCTLGCCEKTCKRCGEHFWGAYLTMTYDTYLLGHGKQDAFKALQAKRTTRDRRFKEIQAPKEETTREKNNT